jgi:hypothetical protein
MKLEIDEAIKKVKASINTCNNALKELEKIKSGYQEMMKYDEDEKASFIRFDVSGYYNKNFKGGVWHLVLDNNKSSVVVKSRRGFDVKDLRWEGKYQIVDSTRGTADLLLSEDKASRELANTILDTISNEKYKKKKYTKS